MTDFGEFFWSFACDLIPSGCTQMSQTMDFSRSQKRRLNAMIDEVYEEFLRKVSEGRGMSAKMARKVANGRVWTGEDAYRLGLVDKLGGRSNLSTLPPRGFR